MINVTPCQHYQSFHSDTTTLIHTSSVMPCEPHTFGCIGKFRKIVAFTINHLMKTVFVEQPLPLPWSARNIKYLESEIIHTAGKVSEASLHMDIGVIGDIGVLVRQRLYT